MGLIDGELVINPLNSKINDSDLNLVIAGTSESIMMVESSANEISEAKMLEALEAGHDVIKTICEMGQKGLTLK